MKRRATTRKNAWPFSSRATAPRNTTAASGGIATHSKGAKTKRAKVAIEFKGYRISSSGEGFKTTPGDGTEFDTVQDAKRFISDEVKLARNPAKRKRNPAQEAIAGYEDFHGRPPQEFVEVKRKVHFHSNLSSAGELKRLVVLTVDGKAVVTMRKFKGALLAFNERRNQLFVEGGDQAVNLADFGIETEHELETLGRVKKIDYFTTKTHLGEDGGTATYQHTFRTTNENGKHVTIRIARYPDLIYRVLERHLEFSGGSYEILPEGIDR